MDLISPTFLSITGPGAFIFVVIFIIVALFPFVFYLLTLQSVLKEIGPENRKMEAVQVWLSVIPIFGIIWQYIIVSRMADSLKLELEKRNIYSTEARPAFKIGIAYCILLSCMLIPFFGIISALGGVACWILYWVKINDYRNLLIENPINYLQQ